MKRPLVIALALAVSSSAFGWIDTGHMIVAAIAEGQLKPAVKAKVDALLKIGGDDRTRTFWTSACWADDTKNSENGPWHYINIHFREDGKPADNKPLDENVDWAIHKFSKILADPKQPETDRADALRFLIHFVGDAHCPVHAVARDTEAFPRGDRGANDFKILPPPGVQPEPRNLHFLWDIAGGLYGGTERPLTKEGTESIRRLAATIQSEFPRTSFAAELKETAPEAWSQESYELARKVAYNLPEKTVPSPEYLRRCQEVSKKRIALAGYRLSDLLNRVLD